MIIVGAGMAGLLAANMLARRMPKIIEAQPKLPNNHSAVLRFRSSVVGDVLGIPFRKVQMIKAPLPWRNPVSDALAYSYKCTGQYRSDRSITAGLVTQTRYIAPYDLIERMAEIVSIEFNKPFSGDHFGNRREDEALISTLPMPDLMSMLKYPDTPEFNYINGINIKATVQNCDAFVSLLIPDPEQWISRISITGNELIIELPMVNDCAVPKQMVKWAADQLGIAVSDIECIDTHRQTYAKIAPIDNDVRKRFIAWATDNHNIYSLGRYATWRPNLLLDDLVNDIRCIESWVSNPPALRQHRYEAISRSK